jgi:hypothetical protein
MTSPYRVELMSESMRSRYEACAPERQDRFTKAGLDAIYLRAAFDEAAENVRWFEGDKGSLVAWHNFCPLIVSMETRDLGDSHSVVISGHMSSSSTTLAGALQEAVMWAVECGREGSDSRWLNGRGGRKGFFASHGVEEGVTPSRTLADYLVPEHMHPRNGDAPDEEMAPYAMR